MKKIKFIFFSLVILFAVFFLLIPPTFPDNSDIEKVFSSAVSADFIIVFNPGGWGDTPPEKAEDLSPIIEGIKKSLSERGYESVVVPYYRTERGIMSKLAISKEFFGYFQKQSSDLAFKIGDFLENNNSKKIIMVGLSNGASFVDETMKKISGFKDSVFAVEIGAPFWQKEFDSENILRLNNKNCDSLSRGEVEVLLSTLFKAPAKWFFAKISGARLSFSMAFNFPQHKYFWDSPEVGSRIISFIDDKLIAKKF
jgi:hypothetical protein